MAVPGAAVDGKASFVQFVYPFLYETETFAEREATLEQAQWPGREQRLWQAERFPEDEMLPHVARFLNPPKDTPATVRLWQLESGALDSTTAGLGGQVQWQLTFPRHQIPIQFEAVRPALFRIGVGLLTVRVKPVSATPPDWYDFLHFFRFARGQRGVGLEAHRRVGVDPQTRQPQMRPFFPEPAGGLISHPEGKGTLGDLLDALLRTGALPKDPTPWWREVFVSGQLLPFAVLYIDQLPPDETTFLLYRLRNFFHARQTLHPAPEDLRLDHVALLPYADQQWFGFSLDGGSFVACDAPRTDFFRVVLPSHLYTQYFLLSLLALHQRFALMKFSEEVAQNWLTCGNQLSTEERQKADEEREAAFERIRDALLSFTARGHFVQVMQREHHHRCYRKWQENFQVDRLYQEVLDEVREMHSYLLLRRTERLQTIVEAQRKQAEEEARAEVQRDREAQERARRLEERISWLSVGIGVPAVLFSFLGINIKDFTNSDGLSVQTAWGIGIGIVVSELAAMALWWLFRRWQTRRHSSDLQAP